MNLFLPHFFLYRFRILNLDTETPKCFIRYHRPELPLLKVLGILKKKKKKNLHQDNV